LRIGGRSPSPGRCPLPSPRPPDERPDGGTDPVQIGVAFRRVRHFGKHPQARSHVVVPHARN
ncbi:MAG: hypothetical protein ACRDNL_25925, partial [Spirillospora sp.]